MSPADFLLMAGACLYFMATPGPGIFAVVARSFALGWRRNLGFLAGMVVGDLVLLALALGGLAAVAHAFEELFTLLRFAAAGYLIWLGVRTWRAPVTLGGHLPEAEGAQLRGFASGLALTLSNPKTILFYMAFLPAFVDLTRVSATEAMLMAGIVVGVLSTVLLTYAMAASRTRHLFRSERAMKALNQGAGSLMIGAGVAVAAR
ncbi:LysE family translocator [Azospirillum brasilense]|uniref:LysE family translocator n=1 Tax=Azospirillum brasilense TaxID=192 RepID=UPI000E6835E9|nr:LysE family translocator [Azospirillum brasilense]NUB25123.1 LysE family translocator [Azospirillum brasilense]NUB31374.1 LysE family translocator [Azospirillum brasilense]RIW07646.1 LysE family translocator [Azospirillum brasilense]